MRLGAPLRGVVYGLALVVGFPLAWSDGKLPVAVFIFVAVLVGIGLEVLATRRN